MRTSKKIAMFFAQGVKEIVVMGGDIAVNSMYFVADLLDEGITALDEAGDEIEKKIEELDQ